jgi:RHS repeat-associated protein
VPMKVRYTVVDGEVVSEVRSGVRRDYVTDSLGSTIALVDGAQAVTDTWEYWPYGEVRTRTGTTPTPFQFVGTLGYYRDSAKRTYVRARHYRQDLGRWATVDRLWPVVPAYTYSENAPSYKSDPRGLAPRRVGRVAPASRNLPPIVGRPRWNRCNPVQLIPSLILLCINCLNEQVLPDLGEGGDKSLHCMAGCLASFRCPCPSCLGELKEVYDVFMRAGEFDPWDAVATDDGYRCAGRYPTACGRPRKRPNRREQIEYCSSCCKSQGWDKWK